MNEASLNGNGWSASGQPYLSILRNEHWDHTAIIRVHDGASTYDFDFSTFMNGGVGFGDRSGANLHLSYIAPTTNGLGDRLPGEFQLTDAAGNITSFYDLPRETYDDGYQVYARLFSGAGNVQEQTYQWTDSNATVYTDPTDGTADKYRFGSFKGFTDASGRLVVTTDHDNDGNLTGIVRTDGSGQYERFDYDYGAAFTNGLGGSATLLRTAALQKGTSSSGPWTTIRSASYDYYVGDESGDTKKYGRLGDLKTVVIRDFQRVPVGGEIIENKYYRYTKMYGNAAETYTGYDTRGPTNTLATTGGTDTDFTEQTYDNMVMSGLRSVFEGAAYARLAANRGGVSSFQDDADVDVNPYANHVFGYERDDSSPGYGVGLTHFRVVSEVAAGEGCSTCSGGFGTFKYDYEVLDQYNLYHPGNTNTPVLLFTEYLPDTTSGDWTDNDRRIVYVNNSGAPILEMLVDQHGTSSTSDDTRTLSLNRYDDEGRLEFVVHSDAIGYFEYQTDDYPELVDWYANTEKFLLNDQGLVEHYVYGTSTTATDTTAGDVDGLLKGRYVRRGYDGTDIQVAGYEYFEHEDGITGSTVHPLAVQSAYWDIDGDSDNDAVDTTYDYTWYLDTGNSADTNAIASLTVTSPGITTGASGPSSATTATMVYDTAGRAVWVKDSDGYIHYTEYDPATGAVVKQITDVDTSQTTTFANKPSGWTTPGSGGLHLTTAYQLDDLGRTKKVTDPKGNVTHIVYLDASHEVRQYRSASGSFSEVGPVQVSRTYWPVQSASSGQRTVYSESLTTSATPSLSSGVPTGAETIDESNILSLSRSITNNAGQMIESDAYTILSGVTYAITTATLGSSGTNYNATLSDYESGGRLKRMESATGTVTRYLYDARGLLTETWVGTDDIPSSGYWSPSNQTGTNLTKVLASTYDRNGHEVTSTAYPNGSTNPRVTQTFYDWRGRAVIVKQGASASESDGTHRPIVYYTYDNQDRVTAVEHYDGDGLLLPVTDTTGPDLVNPGFESPGVDPDQIWWQPAGVGDWRFGVSSGIADGDYATVRPVAQAGDQGLVLNFGSAMSYGIRQMIGDWGDGTYSISFYASEADPSGSETMEVLIDDKVVGTITPSGGTYTTYATSSFSVSAGSHMLSIRGTTTNAGNIYLDSFSITPVSASRTTVDSNDDGVPDKPSSSLLRGKQTTAYDDQGRAFRQNVFSVNPSTGSVSSDALTTNVFFDKRGNVIKTSQPGGLVSKCFYDGAGRKTKCFTTDGYGDADWTDAGSVSDDHVLEQTAYTYDANSNVILTTTKQRFHDATDDDELGTPSSSSGTAKARVYYSAGWYDAANRVTDTADLGTNGGNVYAIPSSGPALSNAGFETPNVGTGSWGAFAYHPSSAGWTFDNWTGVAGNGSGFTSSNPNAPTGTQVGLLQFGDGFQQSVSGWEAGTYRINFDAAQRFGSNQDFQVLIDGNVVGTFTPGSIYYQEYATATFTVAAGSHTVRFDALDTATGDNTAFIDDILIVPAVPDRSDTALVTSYDYDGALRKPLDNSGFEAPTLAANSYSYGPPELWQFSGYAGVAANGSGFTSSNPDAPEGSQVALLQFTSSLSQSVTAAAGTYVVKFKAAQRTGNAAQQDFQVKVDGSVVNTFTPSSTSYGSYNTSTLTLTSGSHLIQFVALNTAGGDNTAFIDAVSVEPVFTGARLQEVTDPRGIVSQSLSDMLGRTTSTNAAYVDGTPSNADDQITRYTYDGNGNVLTLTADMPSGTNDQVTQYVYGVTSGGGSNITSNDLLKEVRYPDKSTGAAGTASSDKEQYLYNALGQAIQLTDQNGNVHQYSYDTLGRQTIDKVSTLGSGVDGAVRRLETAYNTQGLPEMFTSYDAASSGSVVNEVQRVYNGLGQLTTEYQEHSGAVNTSTTAKVQYAYTEMASSANHSRLKSMTYPNGRILRYEYSSGLDNNISRLSYLADDSSGSVGTHLEEYSYLGLGTIVRAARPEPGTELTYIDSSPGDAGDQYAGLDRFGRVVDQRWKVTSGGTALDRFQYGYDKNGNPLYKNNTVQASVSELYHGNSSTGGDNASAYDPLNRLTGFRRGTLSSSGNNGAGLDEVDTGDLSALAGKTRTWSLDALGNQTATSTDGTSESNTHNSGNQLTSFDGNTLTFDNNGNTTTDEIGRTMTYDAWNRLVHSSFSSGSPHDSDSTDVDLGYDALGRHITDATQVVNDHLEIYSNLGHIHSRESQTSSYYSANWQVLEEHSSVDVTDIEGNGPGENTPDTSSTTSASQYIWGQTYIDDLVLRDRDADNNGYGDLGISGSGLEERLYAQHDANHNVTSLTNASGSVQERFVYDPYGSVTVLSSGWSATSDSYAWVYLHQGTRYVSELGLYDVRHRFYSPTLGRWVQEDPIGYADGLNDYLYTNSSPVAMVDPTGLAGAQIIQPPSRPSQFLDPPDQGGWPHEIKLKWWNQEFGKNGRKVPFIDAAAKKYCIPRDLLLFIVANEMIDTGAHDVWKVPFVRSSFGPAQVEEQAAIAMGAIDPKLFERFTSKMGRGAIRGAEARAAAVNPNGGGHWGKIEAYLETNEGNIDTAASMIAKFLDGLCNQANTGPAFSKSFKVDVALGVDPSSPW